MVLHVGNLVSSGRMLCRQVWSNPPDEPHYGLCWTHAWSYWDYQVIIVLHCGQHVFSIIPWSCVALHSMMIKSF